MIDKENSSDKAPEPTSGGKPDLLLLPNLFPPSLFAFRPPATAGPGDFSSQCYYSDHGVKAVEEAKELVPFRELLQLLDDLPSSVKQLA